MGGKLLHRMSVSLIRKELRASLRCGDRGETGGKVLWVT